MELPEGTMPSSTLLLKDFRSFPDGACRPPNLDKAHVEMSSSRKQTERGDEDGVDSVILSDLINFLSGLALNPSTADATILEIQALSSPIVVRNSPTFARNLPSFPAVFLWFFPAIHADNKQPATHTFPPSPQSSCGSSQVQASNSLINAPTLLPLTAFTTIHADGKQPATGTHALREARVTPNVARAGPIAVPGKSNLLAPSTPQTASSVFTAAFGNANIMPSTRFEVLPESLKSLPVVGLPKLRAFILHTPRGEDHWQQRHKGLYFDVPSPDVAGPYYLVTKGTRIGVLATW
ncbi:hypothetical protein EV401DRAFT_2198603 [Pisolithus croceorrhizus]|nr:hypothetical protein EV401DRAFT_2198603 [Pisolithus croceorrhizus]